jgi:insertion element IS1 protein InsB
VSHPRSSSDGYGMKRDYTTRKVLAYVLAPHEDAAFLELKALLKPFGIVQFFTDGWGAYQRHLDNQAHIIGKSNTQTIERKHLTLRTRIKRYEFGRAI